MTETTSETTGETRSEQASAPESSRGTDDGARAERGDLNGGGSPQRGGEGAEGGTRSEQGSEQHGIGRGSERGEPGAEQGRATLDQASRGERGSLDREGWQGGESPGRAVGRDGRGDLEGRADGGRGDGRGPSPGGQDEHGGWGAQRGVVAASDQRHDTYIGNSDNPRPPVQHSDTPKAYQQPEGEQSKKPEAGPDKSEPNQSYKQSEGEQSKKPEAGPDKSESNQSREREEPKESKKPPDGPNRSDGGNGVVIRNPLGPGRHDGRGATGPGGHGLDKDPSTKDWASKAAKDMKAEPGTAVKAMTDGKIVSITPDNRTDKTGKVYGDQVTIVSSNGAVKTFYTHINASQELKDKLEKNPGGIEVHRGDTIGTVARWGDNPSESHLHVGMAARGADGSYHGVDPSAALSASRDADRDLTVTPDGGYIVGDNKYTVQEAASATSGAGTKREVDRDDTPGATRR